MQATPQHTTWQQATPQHATWQQALTTAITDPAELLSILGLNPTLLPAALLASKDFTCRVPRAFVARMQHGDLNDPLLRQILPLGEELISTPNFSIDPLKELASNPLPGLLHKYHGRVLLTIASACAINCRYCFRRHFPYDDNNPGRQGWQQAIDYIKNDPSIHEVIFSGGEPLIATDNHLAEIAEALNRIPHVKTLRFHTRLPIVIPERITDDFIKLLTQLRLKPVIIIHCNHANEIDDNVAQALKKCTLANITLLNQSVLLKGVNDSAETLINLSNKLFSHGVLPYYLHMLDRVQGAAHFEIDELQAKKYHQQMSASLPGYLVPRLVREQAHAEAKVNV